MSCYVSLVGNYSNDKFVTLFALKNKVNLVNKKYRYERKRKNKNKEGS